MKLHANARLSVKGRELLVDRVENARRASGWPDLHPPTARTADKERSPSRCREPDVISENPSSADSGHTPNAGGLVRGAVLARSSLGPDSTVGLRGRRAAARQRARVDVTSASAATAGDWRRVQNCWWMGSIDCPPWKAAVRCGWPLRCASGCASRRRVI